MNKIKQGMICPFPVTGNSIGQGVTFAGFSRMIMEKYTVPEHYFWEDAVMQYLLQTQAEASQKVQMGDTIQVVLNLLRIYLNLESQNTQSLCKLKVITENLKQNIEMNLRLLPAGGGKVTERIRYLYTNGLQLPEEKRKQSYLQLEQMSREYGGGAFDRRKSIKPLSARLTPCSAGQPFERMLSMAANHSRMSSGKELFYRSAERQQRKFYLRMMKDFVIEKTESFVQVLLQRELHPFEKQMVKDCVNHKRTGELLAHIRQQDSWNYEEMAETVFRQIQTADADRSFKTTAPPDYHFQESVLMAVPEILMQLPETVYRKTTAVILRYLTEHTRAEHTGAEHAGAEQTGAEHARAEVIGTEHTRAEHAGAEVIGKEHTRAEHTGSKHMGAEHTGAEHTGAEHAGAEQTGSKHTGAEVIGSENTGTAQDYIKKSELFAKWQTLSTEDHIFLFTQVSELVNQIADFDHKKYPDMPDKGYGTLVVNRESLEVVVRQLDQIKALYLRSRNQSKMEQSNLAEADFFLGQPAIHGSLAMEPEIQAADGQNFWQRKLPELIMKLPEPAYQIAAADIMEKITGQVNEGADVYIERRELLEIWQSAGYKYKEQILIQITGMLNRDTVSPAADDRTGSFLYQQSDKLEQILKEREIGSTGAKHNWQKELPELIMKLPEPVYQTVAADIIEKITGQISENSDVYIERPELLEKWQSAGYKYKEQILLQIAGMLNRDTVSPAADDGQGSFLYQQSDPLKQILKERKIGSTGAKHNWQKELPELIMKLPEPVYQTVAADIIEKITGQASENAAAYIERPELLEKWQSADFSRELLEKWQSASPAGHDETGLFLHQQAVSLVQILKEQEAGNLGAEHNWQKELPELIMKLPEQVYQTVLADLIAKVTDQADQAAEGYIERPELLRKWQSIDYKYKKQILVRLTEVLNRSTVSPAAEVGIKNQWQSVLQEQLHRETEAGSMGAEHNWQKELPELIMKSPESMYQTVITALAAKITSQAGQGANDYIGRPELLKKWQSVDHKYREQMLIRITGAEHLNQVNVMESIWVKRFPELIVKLPHPVINSRPGIGRKTGGNEGRRIRKLPITAERLSLIKGQEAGNSYFPTAIKCLNPVHQIQQMSKTEYPEGQIFHQDAPEKTELLRNERLDIGIQIKNGAVVPELKNLLFREPRPVQKDHKTNDRSVQELSVLETRITKQEYMLSQEIQQVKELKELLLKNSDEVKQMQEMQTSFIKDYNKTGKLPRRTLEQIKEQLYMERIRHGLD